MRISGLKDNAVLKDRYFPESPLFRLRLLSAGGFNHKLEKPLRGFLDGFPVHNLAGVQIDPAALLLSKL